MESFIIKLLHLPPLASEHGAQVDRLLLFVHVLMFALFALLMTASIRAIPGAFGPPK